MSLIQYQEQLEQLVVERTAELMHANVLLKQEIDRRRESEKALHEQLHFLQRLLDTIPNPICYKDAQGIFQGCNVAYENYIGLRKDEVIGKTVYEVYPKDLADIYYEMDMALFNKPGVQVYDTLCQMADGTRRNVLLNKAVHKDTNGNVAGLVGVIVDITDHKQMEKALRESQERYKELVKYAPAGIYEIDLLKVKFTNANDLAYEYLGYTREEFLSMSPFEILSGASKKHFANRLKNHLSSQNVPETTKFKVKAKDGQELWILSHARYIYKNGRPVKATVVCHDVTKHMQMEEALRESENRYRQLIEHSPYLIAVYSRGKIIFINKAGAKLVGAQYQEQLIGKPVIDFVHPSYRNIVKERIQHIYHTGRTAKSIYKEKLIRLDGAVIDLDLIAYPFIFQGKRAITIIARDNGEEKRLQKEMQRLENLNLIAQMAAGIAHEIRNPMTTVRGFLQLLSKKDDCCQYSNYYNLMIAELDRVNYIITEFLSLAKNKTVELEMHNLNSIIKAILPLIEADAMNADKFVEFYLADVPDLLLNEKEIRQLVLNLCLNGLEAMSPGGRLTIKTYPDGKEVVLLVQDQGPGIDPDLMVKLGTPFITTKEKGTGLGLPVCYSIASRHHAEVRVETSSRGTIFTVRFKDQEIMQGDDSIASTGNGETTNLITRSNFF